MYWSSSVRRAQKYLRSSLSTIKKKSLTTKGMVVLGVLVIAITAGGIRTAQVVSSHNKTKEQARQAEIARLNEHKQKMQSIEESQNKDDKTKDDSKTTEPNAADDPNAIKYSISSDPRSTAYSTTPPAPNPAIVDIRITHSGQVKIGTLISYNPTKDESKTYYGGELVFSPSTVVIHKSVSNVSQNFTVSMPGGKTASGGPNAPWYDPGDTVFAASDSNSYTGPGTSWVMFASLFSKSTPNGTYYLHVVTGYETSSTVGWQYDGFLPVVVKD